MLFYGYVFNNFDVDAQVGKPHPKKSYLCFEN